MDAEKKLERQFDEYLNLHKENKNVDIAGLMLNALQNQKKNLVSEKQKRWAYLISIGIPPFGFLFALNFYLSDKEDGKSVGNVCIVLTILSVLSFWAISKMLFSGSGTSLNQIQQITPQDIQQLSQ
jgi:hypothetical protein